MSTERLREIAKQLMLEFKGELESEHGLVGHPKADNLFDIAWAYGHSAGYSEVRVHYETLSELLK